MVVVLGEERPPVRRIEPSLAARPERCFLGFNLNVFYVCVVNTCVCVCMCNFVS